METDDAVPEAARAAIERHPAVRDVRVIPAERAGDADGEQETTGPKATPSMAEDAEARFARCDFVSGAELLARCAEGSCAISQAFREREEALCALDGHAANVDAYLERVLQVMRASATESIARPVHSTGGLIGGEAPGVGGVAAGRGHRDGNERRRRRRHERRRGNDAASRPAFRHRFRLRAGRAGNERVHGPHRGCAYRGIGRRRAGGAAGAWPPPGADRREAARRPSRGSGGGLSYCTQRQRFGCRRGLSGRDRLCSRHGRRSRRSR